MKTLLVGESNPYGSDPRYALYPMPERSAGANLCTKVMGMVPARYIRTFDRVNLCAGKWSMPEARATALRIVSEGRPALVLCGARVCKAFGLFFRPFESYRPMGGVSWVILPHPSGLSRAWNEPGAYERARAVLREAGVL